MQTGDGRAAGASGATPALAVGLLMVAFGLGAFALLISNILAVTGTVAAGEDGGITLLRFLNAYGIIVPLILLGVGVYLVWLGSRVLSRSAAAASWARQILLWFTILGVVLIVQSFLAGASVPAVGNIVRAIEYALPWVAMTIAVGAAWWWLNKNIGGFRGQETLEQASSRNAWNLLIPTIIVLIVVALRPLEATFVASLTDQRFAGGADRQVNFVGFDNYARLLGVRFDMIECTRGDDGLCLRNGAGVVVFPRVRDAVDSSYIDLRYRETGRVELGDRVLVISARDQQFMSAVSNTLTFTAVSVTLELLLGLFIALVINSKFAGRGLMRTAMLVPWAIPTVVSARLWEVMLRDNQSGVINHLLVNLGFLPQSQAWLATPSLQIPALIAIDVWKTTPFMALILLAGLQTISADVYEAADVDGAGKIRQFFAITLPLLRPTIAIALVFRTLDAIRVFDVFQVLLGRQQLSMATYNYDTLVNNQQLGYASAVGVVIFVIILIFTVTYVRVLGVSAE